MTAQDDARRELSRHRSHLTEMDQVYYVEQKDIDAAHPLRTKEYGPHNAATVLVGERDSKGDLVDLVNYWICRAARAERLLGAFVRKVDMQLNGFDHASACPTPAEVLGQMRRENIKSVTRRPSRPGIMFAIGRPDGKNGYAMLHGPTPDIQEMLAVMGGDGDCLLRFDAHQQYDLMFVSKDGHWTNPAVPF